MTSAALNDDALFVFPADDPYWKSGGNVGRGLYEPEIDWVMLRSVGRPYALIDCGANMGYWSVLASSRPYGQHPVMAIEAAASNFEILLINRQANQNRFSTLHRAVTAQTGDKVRLYGRKHYGMSLRRDWHPADSSEFEEVETITIDEAAGHFPPSRAHPALIKIDVEGAEIEAIQGASQLIDQGALLVFEDHGKEPTHAISRFVLAQEAIVVWWIEGSRPPVRIAAIEQVAAIKQNPISGYNFFACRGSSPWLSVFQS